MLVLGTLWSSEMEYLRVYTGIGMLWSARNQGEASMSGLYKQPYVVEVQAHKSKRLHNPWKVFGKRAT